MMEATTLASAVLVGFCSTEGAVEAGWKYLIVCTVGLAFALFGTIVFYVAAVHAGLKPESPLQWTVLEKARRMLAAPQSVRYLGVFFPIVGLVTELWLRPIRACVLSA